MNAHTGRWEPGRGYERMFPVDVRLANSVNARNKRASGAGGEGERKREDAGRQDGGRNFDIRNWRRSVWWLNRGVEGSESPYMRTWKRRSRCALTSHDRARRHIEALFYLLSLSLSLVFSFLPLAGPLGLSPSSSLLRSLLVASSLSPRSRLISYALTECA